MKKLVFILVGARKRVGKDTASKHIVSLLEKAGRQVASTSFANELKLDVNKMAQAVNLSINAFTEDAHEKEKIVRPLLIAYGMARRVLDQNYWVRKVVDFTVERIDDIFAQPANVTDDYAFVVISDWRFPNELNHLRELGHTAVGITIRRPSVRNDIPEEIENAPLCEAISEFTVLNDTDIDRLYSQLNWLTGYIARAFPAK